MCRRKLKRTPRASRERAARNLCRKARESRDTEGEREDEKEREKGGRGEGRNEGEIWKHRVVASRVEFEKNFQIRILYETRGGKREAAVKSSNFHLVASGAREEFHKYIRSREIDTSPFFDVYLSPTPATSTLARLSARFEFNESEG